MGSLLDFTLNTRALPTGNMRYIRSDYPGRLSDQGGFISKVWSTWNSRPLVCNLRRINVSLPVLGEILMPAGIFYLRKKF